MEVGWHNRKFEEFVPREDNFDYLQEMFVRYGHANPVKEWNLMDFFLMKFFQLIVQEFFQENWNRMKFYETFTHLIKLMWARKRWFSNQTVYL